MFNIKLKLTSLFINIALTTGLVLWNVFTGGDLDGYICIPIMGLLVVANIAMTTIAFIELGKYIQNLEFDRRKLRKMEFYTSLEVLEFLGDIK